MHYPLEKYPSREKTHSLCSFHLQIIRPTMSRCHELVFIAQQLWLWGDERIALRQSVQPQFVPWTRRSVHRWSITTGWWGQPKNISTEPAIPIIGDGMFKTKSNLQPIWVWLGNFPASYTVHTQLAWKLCANGVFVPFPTSSVVKWWLMDGQLNGSLNGWLIGGQFCQRHR